MLKNTISMAFFTVILFSSVACFADNIKPKNVNDSAKVTAFVDVEKTNQVSTETSNASQKDEIVQSAEADNASNQTVAALLLVALIGFVGLSNRSSV
jgi:hypothetical protein